MRRLWVYVPIHPVSAQIQQTSTAPSSSSTGAWHTVKRTKPKVATYGIRKDNTSVFKANPRRHEFVVFNVPRGTEVDVKQYIASNNVDVIWILCVCPRMNGPTNLSVFVSAMIT